MITGRRDGTHQAPTAASVSVPGALRVQDRR